MTLQHPDRAKLGPYAETSISLKRTRTKEDHPQLDLHTLRRSAASRHDRKRNKFFSWGQPTETYLVFLALGLGRGHSLSKDVKNTLRTKRREMTFIEWSVGNSGKGSIGAGRNSALPVLKVLEAGLHIPFSGRAQIF